MDLRQFQRTFIKAATAPGIDTAALSLPRANGKSALAGHLLARILDPNDVLFRSGTESVLCAASIEQARIVFRFARETLEPTGQYRFLDASTRVGITHTPTNTKLRVIGSNGKTAFGLVGCPWAICDEPGAWEVNGGTLLFDAIETAKGKPGSPLRALYIGTLAPAVSGWWHDMIADGTHGTTYVQALRGEPERWDQWPEIRRVNPLTAISADFRRKLLEERDAARSDSRLKARFLSFRLNVPAGGRKHHAFDHRRLGEGDRAPGAGAGRQADRRRGSRWRSGMVRSRGTLAFGTGRSYSSRTRRSRSRRAGKTRPCACRNLCQAGSQRGSTDRRRTPGAAGNSPPKRV